MEPSQWFQPAFPIPDEDPSPPPFDSLLKNNQTPPHFVVPKTQISTWSTPSPHSVNPYRQSQLNFDLQERPNILTIATNTHNPQSITFTNSTAATQAIPKTTYSHQPIFSTLNPLDATRTPQLTHAPPLTSQLACINSTASSSFILPLSNPPIHPNFSTSSLTCFPSTQFMHAIDLTINSTRMTIHQRLTLPSNFYTSICSPSVWHPRSHARLISTYTFFPHHNLWNPWYSHPAFLPACYFP